MFERAANNPNAPRHILAALSVSWAVLGLGTLQLPWLTWPPLWASMYFVAAAMCVAYAAKFDRHVIGAFAGAASIAANVMRGSVIVLAWLTREPATRSWTFGQIVVGVVTSWTLAFVVAVLFFRRLTPLASVERLK